MTTADSIDEREVIFINERARVDYEGMPDEVQESADQAVNALQNGHALPVKMRASLDGDLSGIDEIRLPYGGDTYRVYVYLGCKYVVIILDAGQKKSPTGAKIPKWQIERLEARLTRARAYCKGHDATLRAAYEEPKTRRSTFEKRLKESRRSAKEQRK